MKNDIDNINQYSYSDDNNNYYRLLFENMSIGALYQRADGHLIDINPAALEIFGLTKEEFFERTSNHQEWKAVNIHNEVLEGDKHPSMVALRTGKITNSIIGVYNPLEQKNRWLNISTIPQFKVGKEKPYMVIVTMIDITSQKQAEDEREQFLKFFNIAPTIMVIADPNGAFKKVNPFTLEVLGYTEEELISKPFVEFIHPDDKQNTLDEMAKQIKSGFSLNFENRYLCKDGTYKWLSWKASYIKDEGNTYATARDITELKLSEIELKANYSLLRTAGRTAKLGGWYADVQTNKVIWSDEVAEIHEMPLGYSPSIEEGINFYTPEHRDKIKELVSNCIERGIAFDHELQIITPKNNKIWVRATGESVTDNHGKIFKVQGSFQDIDNIKKQEEINISRFHLIKYSINHTLDELLEEILNEAEKLTNSLIGFFHFVDPNQEYLKLQNWSKRTKQEFCKAEGKGSHYAIEDAGVWVDCVHTRAPVIHNDYKSLINKKGMPIGHAEVIRELVVPIFRGEKITAILGIGNKATDYDQRDIETVTIIADLAWEIAERKRTEEELMESEKQFRQLFNMSPNAIFVIDENAKFVNANLIAIERYGYSLEEFKQLTTADLAGNNYSEQAIPQLKKGLQSEMNFEWVHSTKDGNNFPVEIHTKPIIIHGQNYTFAEVQDITQRKKSETALRLSELKYRTLHETMRDGYVLVDMNGLIVDWNDTYLKMLGYNSEEIKKMSYSDITPQKWHSFESEIVNNQILKLGYSDVYEKEYIKKDMTVFPVELRAFLVKDENGINQGIWALVRDITERKKIEKTLKENEAKFRELNATKDKFFSIIAHDLRSPFNSIIGFSNLLAEQIKEKDYEGIEEYAGYIQLSSQKAMDLLMNLLQWTRSQTGRMDFNAEFIEIVGLVNNVSELLADQAKQKSITILKQMPKVAPALADKAMVNTILRNLLSNAIKFTKPRGLILIKIESDNSKLIISVKDNGVGIKPEDIDKLFKIEQSHTTTGTQNETGTGLGLILCSEFIKKHDEKIWVESEYDKGSTFSFTLKTY